MIKKSVQNISKKFKPTIYEYFGTRLHKHTNTHTHARARARAHARTHAHTQTRARARVGIHISVDADKENTWKPRLRRSQYQGRPARLQAKIARPHFCLFVQ